MADAWDMIKIDLQIPSDGSLDDERKIRSNGYVRNNYLENSQREPMGEIILYLFNPTFEVIPVENPTRRIDCLADLRPPI